MRRYNLHDAEFTDHGDPDGFHARVDRIGPKVGGERLGASLYLVPPGQSLCPYHYEYNEEEWLLVLEGRPTLRHPEGEDELREGDIVAFREGPSGAHQVTNHGDTDARVLMWANRSSTGIVVYPDSDKIMANPPDDADHIIVRRSSGVDYWDGESPPQPRR
jgi:uncharacterized cupin superfamily protein